MTTVGIKGLDFPTTLKLRVDLAEKNPSETLRPTEWQLDMIHDSLKRPHMQNVSQTTMINKLDSDYE